jgi:hypothetical protein
MSIQDTRDPEDEVPELKKYQISFTLDSFATALLEKAQLIVDASAASGLVASDAQPQIPPEVQPHVKRIREIAGELKAEIDAINQIDPDLLNRLKQG